jgi:two-component system alkaline phosphatase synthesis response regulator PhoP
MEGQGKILVADDDLDIVKALQKILELQAYRVTVATNGEECLEKIKDGRPDLIILDLLMPKMNGFDVIRALKESPQYSGYDSIPLLILTAVREDASRRRYEMETGLAMDVDAYVEKPIHPMDLLHRVTQLLERGREEGKD